MIVDFMYVSMQMYVSMYAYIYSLLMWFIDCYLGMCYIISNQDGEGWTRNQMATELKHKQLSGTQFIASFVQELGKVRNMDDTSNINWSGVLVPLLVPISSLHQ